MVIIGFLNQIDQQLLIFLNSFHSPLWDSIMLAITSKILWIPFYVLIAVTIYFFYPKNWWLIIPFIILSVIVADAFASSLMKPLFGRLRPCYSTIAYKLHLPTGCGGQFGFISSHAANTFDLASILFLLFRNQLKWVWLLFIWAIIVSYSRIYLGVHYPGDIISGAITGVIWGILFYKVFIITDTYRIKKLQKV